jgi:ParB family transcriptional regulator, chromosome partitioning protein
MNKDTQNETRTGKLNHVPNANLNSNRAEVEWVSISEVMPNPLNPRKNDAIDADVMKSIIKKRGFEEPLTVYKRGNVYVLLAGHRRFFAAKEANVKQLPVYVVDAPKSHQEEIERIASLQSGRVDWEPLEWGMFTYERWIAWGKPEKKKFAKEINLKPSVVSTYLTVLDNFPLDEIETGLRYKSLTFTMLHAIHDWMNVLKRSHPKVVENLTRDMIRRTLVEKAMQKMVDRENLRKTDFLNTVEDQDVQDWLMSKTKHYADFMNEQNFDPNEKTFHGSMVSMARLKRTMKQLNPKSFKEAERAAMTLKELRETLETQMKALEKKYPDLTKQDEWKW